jgi:hypothetical protein
LEDVEEYKSETDMISNKSHRSRKSKEEKKALKPKYKMYNNLETINFSRTLYDNFESNMDDSDPF